MEKKLPNLYVNKIEKQINNNTIAFYSAHKEKTNEREVDKGKSKVIDDKEEDIKEKIREIFDSPNFVYKMNVTIKLKNNDIINRDIIGQVNGKLLTIDEDLIDIREIKEIRF